MSSDRSVEQVLQFLNDPASYPHRPMEVRIVQTHASIVALVPPYVFKVRPKMPRGDGSGRALVGLSIMPW